MGAVGLRTKGRMGWVLDGRVGGGGDWDRE